MAISSESIWRRFSGQLRGFVRRRVPSPDDVDDILQEIFIKVHTRLHNLRNADRLASWLYQITRNTVIDHFRKTIPSLPLPEEGPAFQEPEVNEAELELAGYLTTLLDCLPQGYQEAVKLYEIGGVSQQQIADRLGLSLSGAKSRVQRGRKMLKDALLDCCHFEFDRTGRIIEYRDRQECCSRHDLCRR